MIKELLEKLKEELEGIKNEGKIEDLKIEKIDENEYEIIPFEEYYERKINIPTKRVFKPKKVVAVAMLGLTLVTGASLTSSNIVSNIGGSIIEVQAKSKKKDNKKPVITYKDKKIKEVEKGKTVKNLGATAKDNVDGNVTKKLKVTVKRGKKSYSSIAKKIKKNKGVKFTNTGTYKIKFTVTDKAGNLATKTRTIKVVAPKKKTTETTTYVEDPTTEEITTEIPTTEITTETPTTEQPITENFTTDPKYRVDYSEFDMDKITINGRTYNVTKDVNFYKITDANDVSDKVFINIENDYDRLVFDAKTGLTNNSSYLNFLGKITAQDENGNDISNNIVIYELPLIADGFVINSVNYVLYIYVEDINGNTLRKELKICLRSFDDINFDELKDLILLNESPLVYGRPRIEENDLSLSTEKAKVFEYVNE